MLYILTGPRQVGKTRLLEGLLASAKAVSVKCVGVITPGIWRRRSDAFVKHGINAVLLPSGEEMLFATNRREGNERLQASENAQTIEGSQAPGNSRPEKTSQSDAAGLGWKISDRSIERINSHLSSIAGKGLDRRDLMVIDELGTLEIIHGKGLTAAMDLIEGRACKIDPAKHTAIVVVRPELVDEVLGRFAPIWGQPRVIEASEDSCLTVDDGFPSTGVIVADMG